MKDELLALIYNLGQNKMRNKPPSPHINDEFARKPKRAFFFSSLKWGEGRGLKFFICFDRDCRSDFPLFLFGKHDRALLAKAMFRFVAEANITFVGWSRRSSVVFIQCQAKHVL